MLRVSSGPGGLCQPEPLKAETVTVSCRPPSRSLPSALQLVDGVTDDPKWQAAGDSESELDSDSMMPRSVTVIQVKFSGGRNRFRAKLALLRPPASAPLGPNRVPLRPCQHYDCPARVTAGPAPGRDVTGQVIVTT